jgi:phage terminase large subunit
MLSEFKIALQPKQQEVYKQILGKDNSVIAFGGAKGSGKSAMVRSIAVLLCMKFKGFRVLIFRRTFSELNENHIIRIFESYPFMRQWYNKVERIVTFPNGSTLRFGYAEYDDDILGFQGKEYDVIFIDESCQCSVYKIGYLKANNRSTHREFRKAKIVLTFNPGGTSHAWHKEKFVDGHLSVQEKEEGWFFMQAHAWDNVEWSRPALTDVGLTVKEYYEAWTDDQRREFFLKKSDYARTLLNLPDEDMVKALLWGDWNVYSGQFYPRFRKDIHVIPDEMADDDSWSRAGAIDDGTTCVFYTGTRDNLDRVIIDNEVYIYDVPPVRRAEMIGAKILEKKLYGLMVYGDTDMFIDARAYKGYDKSTSYFFQQVWDEMFPKNCAPILVPISKKREEAKKYRYLCNQAMKEYMDWKKDDNGNFTKRPHLFVKENCTHLIESIPSLIYDVNDPNDYSLKVGDNHSHDAAKYVLQVLYKPVKGGRAMDGEEDPIERQMKYLEASLKKRQNIRTNFMYY